jgi:hypothetical protein
VWHIYCRIAKKIEKNPNSAAIQLDVTVAAKTGHGIEI